MQIATFSQSGKCRGFWTETGVSCDKKMQPTIAMLYFTLFFCGGVAISVYEDLPLLDCLYEAASAVGTVGLTLGVTPGTSCFFTSCADHTDVSGTRRRPDSDLCSILRKK